MQPIVVYDTNVLISGMVWGGIPYDCIELTQQEKSEKGHHANVSQIFGSSRALTDWRNGTCRTPRR